MDPKKKMAPNMMAKMESELSRALPPGALRQMGPSALPPPPERCEKPPPLTVRAVSTGVWAGGRGVSPRQT